MRIDGGSRRLWLRRGLTRRVLSLLFVGLLSVGCGSGAIGVRAAVAQTSGSAQSQKSEDIEVVYWPGQESLAQRTLEAATRPQRLLGIPEDARLTAGTIYLAPSPAVFDSLTGGRVPEWGAGVAIPALRVIVLPTYPAPGPTVRDPAITLRHELAHLALHAYLPAPIPRWFDEGYATWTSGGWDQSSAWQIRAAFLLGRAPALDSLELTWPRGAEQARLAYLLSASAVRYLAEIGGEEGFTALLDVWRQDGAFDTALRRVYGMTPGQFERAWRDMVKQRYGWLLALSQVTVFWLLITTLLFVLFGIRRRRRRAQLAALELDDRLHPSDPEEELVRGEAPEAETGIDAAPRED